MAQAARRRAVEAFLAVLFAAIFTAFFAAFFRDGSAGCARQKNGPPKRAVSFADMTPAPDQYFTRNVTP